MPPVIVFLVFLIAMWLAAGATPAGHLQLPGRLVIAALLLLSSLVFALPGIAVFRRAGTTVHPMNPHEASTLVTDGVYRISRNPMYAALAMLLAGWAVFLSNAVALLLVPAFIIYMNRFQIIPEERALAAKFGDSYATYAASVRRWL